MNGIGATLTPGLSDKGEGNNFISGRDNVKSQLIASYRIWESKIMSTKDDR